MNVSIFWATLTSSQHEMPTQGTSKLKSTKANEKSAFTKYYGLYKTARISFGLRNDPVMLQEAMDVIPSGGKPQSAALYLEDIVDC